MTINGSTNSNQWTYKLEVSETSYSVQDRTSTIQVKTYLGRASSQSYLGGGYSNSVSATGASTQTQSGTISYPTYINGGAWLLLKTFTLVVPNTSNPTTITISSTLSSNDFNPSYASASGTMQLTILHLDPTIQAANMTETNSVLTALSVPNTTVVRYLSKKTIVLHASTTDNATLDGYRLEHFTTNYNIPSNGTYQSSNTFNTDYTQNDIAISNTNKAKIIQKIKDNMGGSVTDWLYVNIDGQLQEPNGIAYTKPTIERASTSIKRKSGNGVNLTDNKATLNLKATFYKANDIIGNNNNIQQIGYKIWESEASEPNNYTTLTPTISSGNITITDFEISNVSYIKTYKYKIIVKDGFNYQDVIEGTLSTGQSVWTEYSNRVDFLAATIGGNPIVESGSNENGNYIKYYDGTMICYKSVTASVAMTTAWGNLYEGSIALGNWPEDFIATPNVQVTNGSGAGAMIERFTPVPTKTSAGTLYLARAGSRTADVTINVLAIGKWK